MGLSYLHWETSIAPIDLGVETDGGLPWPNIPMDQKEIAVLNGTIEGADVRSIAVGQSADDYALGPLFDSTGVPNQTIGTLLTVSALLADAVCWSLIMDVRPHIFVMPKLKPPLGTLLHVTDPQKPVR